MEEKDEDIYVFICAKSTYHTTTFEYSSAYAIGKDANLDDVIDRITEDMNKHFEVYLGKIDKLPRAGITSMNEISKELYERLSQQH